MHFFNLVTATAILATFQNVAIAFPTETTTETTSLVSRNVEKPPASSDVNTYTVDYFLDKKTQKLQPGNNVCLFYTEQLSGTAKKYAKKNKGISIWDVWGCDYYDYRDKFVGDIVRGANKQKQRQYFGAMSEAYAKMCGGEVKVMTKVPANKLPQNGLWGTREFPALTAPEGKATKITAINTKGEDDRVIYTRPGTATTPDDISSNENGNDGEEDEELDLWRRDDVTGCSWDGDTMDMYTDDIW